MHLPLNKTLSVNALAACFNNTSATYKFYWFLTLLQKVEQGNVTPTKHEIFAGMIANAWYTVNYFHISFGKQDMLQRAIERIKVFESLTIDEKVEKIASTLMRTSNLTSLKELKYFDQEVPWRFLSPWITTSSQKEVYHASQSFANGAPYALYEKHVQINPAWTLYLRENAGVLKAFCYWKLSLYLQKHNPNVPDIPNKLIKPPSRNSLTKQRQFWNTVFDELGHINCIYTRSRLDKHEFAVEHFVPHAFVSHDLIWNLIPACRSFNSTKSDKLPPLDLYFEDYSSLQIAGLEIVRSRQPRNKLLEDYLTIFPDIDLAVSDKAAAKLKLREQVQPLISIAANNGFEFLR